MGGSRSVNHRTDQTYEFFRILGTFVTGSERLVCGPTYPLTGHGMLISPPAVPRALLCKPWRLVAEVFGKFSLMKMMRPAIHRDGRAPFIATDPHSEIMQMKDRCNDTEPQPRARHVLCLLPAIEPA